jgi:hypothetical protein
VNRNRISLLLLKQVLKSKHREKVYAWKPVLKNVTIVRTSYAYNHHYRLFLLFQRIVSMHLNLFLDLQLVLVYFDPFILLMVRLTLLILPDPKGNRITLSIQSINHRKLITTISESIDFNTLDPSIA